MLLEVIEGDDNDDVDAIDILLALVVVLGKVRMVKGAENGMRQIRRKADEARETLAWDHLMGLLLGHIVM